MSNPKLHNKCKKSNDFKIKTLSDFIDRIYNKADIKFFKIDTDRIKKLFDEV